MKQYKSLGYGHYSQTVGLVNNTNVNQINLKVTGDAITVRSHDFEKTF